MKSMYCESTELSTPQLQHMDTFSQSINNFLAPYKLSFLYTDSDAWKLDLIMTPFLVLTSPKAKISIVFFMNSLANPKEYRNHNSFNSQFKNSCLLLYITNRHHARHRKIIHSISVRIYLPRRPQIPVGTNYQKYGLKMPMDWPTDWLYMGSKIDGQ